MALFMQFPQSSIGQTIESERLMVLTASERFGPFFEIAFETNNLLRNSVKKVPPGYDLFDLFLSQVVKFHALALFSFVRLHQVQGLMNLRQVLESVALATYALANPEIIKCIKEGDLFRVSENLRRQAYKWIQKKYHDDSDMLQKLKDDVNKYGAHSNIVQTIHNARCERNTIQISYFDEENPFWVKADLHTSARIAIFIIDLLFRVDDSLRVIVFDAESKNRLSELARHHEILGSQMSGADNFGHS